MFELLLITALLALPAALLTAAVQSLLEHRRDGETTARTPAKKHSARSPSAFGDELLPPNVRSVLLQRHYPEPPIKAGGLHPAVIRELHHRARRER